MSQRFFESPKTVEVRALKGAFLLGGATIFPLPRRLLTMLPERHTFPENGNYWGGPFNSRSPGLPISLVGQEGSPGRYAVSTARQFRSCPRNCRRRAFL